MISTTYMWDFGDTHLRTLMLMIMEFTEGTTYGNFPSLVLFLEQYRTST
jgi:hypothetical protein